MDSTQIRVLLDKALPGPLRSLAKSCTQLYAIGTLPAPGLPRVAVVGSRTPTASGHRMAYEIGRDLARAGVVVVSGLARGIDSAAHRGALDGGGVTVAVLGSGIDVVYPRTSRDLALEIPERGAVISEYPPGTPPLPFQFVHRNRLVAGYTQGTLVVEAGKRSGALITAGLALEMGRELWAVPGDPRRPGCLGNNRLLRDGAGFVLDARDILAGLGLVRGRSQAGETDDPVPAGLSETETCVWSALMREGSGDIEALSRRTGLTAAALLEAVSLLELSGHIERDGEGYGLNPRPGMRV